MQNINAIIFFCLSPRRFNKRVYVCSLIPFSLLIIIIDVLILIDCRLIQIAFMLARTPLCFAVTFSLFWRVQLN